MRSGAKKANRGRMSRTRTMMHGQQGLEKQSGSTRYRAPHKKKPWRSSSVSVEGPGQGRVTKDTTKHKGSKGPVIKQKHRK